MKQQVTTWQGMFRVWCWSMPALIGLLLLSACGGNGADGASVVPERSGQPTTRSLAYGEETIAAQQKGARLNREELDRVARTGVIPKAHEGPVLSDASRESGPTPKSAASRNAVYRFFNTRTSAHFFTTSTVERDNVVATLPFMTYEGAAFHASASVFGGLSPVHRFYNTLTRVHFYTISEAERAHVVATLPHYTYEGVAYFASTLSGTGYEPLYRFFYTAKGFHFYTTSEVEKNDIIASLPQYSYEGVAYYVLGADWNAPATTSTGVSGTQCYKGGTDTLVTCDNVSGANQLYPLQDGHRTGPVDPQMIYLPVPTGSSQENYPFTSCVRDAVTGLIWEGKTDTGQRYGGITLTNRGDNSALDVSNYVSSINASALCGFTDWRLPSTDELQSLVVYGVSDPAKPTIYAEAFPNTLRTATWTETAVADAPTQAWTVDFYTGMVQPLERSERWSVRLVRGPRWSGVRYLPVTIGYGTDASQNAVFDRKTGLTWRRCLEGQIWSGSTCTGTVERLGHESALDGYRFFPGLTGWRLPDVKELASLADHRRVGPALDPDAFPGVPSTAVWSTTPYVRLPNLAFQVSFYKAATQYAFRAQDATLNAVRLVRGP